MESEAETSPQKSPAVAKKTKKIAEKPAALKKPKDAGITKPKAMRKAKEAGMIFVLNFQIHLLMTFNNLASPKKQTKPSTKEIPKKQTKPSAKESPKTTPKKVLHLSVE